MFMYSSMISFTINFEITLEKSSSWTSSTYIQHLVLPPKSGVIVLLFQHQTLEVRTTIYIYIYITQDENTSYFIEILITTDLFRMTSVQLATLIR